jgi:hypothetical protein
MTLDEIIQMLEHAVENVRYPKVDPNSNPAFRVQKLDEYITETAVTRAELERALYWIFEVQAHLEEQWSGIQGWEPLLPNGKRPKDATQEDIKQAKRQVMPDVYDGLRKCGHLRDSLGRQIRRLEKDYDAASRSYSLLTGS